MTDEDYMRKALAEAEQAAREDEIPIGAILVCRGRIIARTHNLTETLCDVTAHAEMQAITAGANALGGKYLTDCTLYVTVEPCPMCAGAIVNARIENLIFGAYDKKSGCAGSRINLFANNLFNHNVNVIGGVLEKECAAVLTDFFKNLRKIKKIRKEGLPRFNLSLENPL